MTDRLERRKTDRSIPTEHGIVSARVRPGREVFVIDLSAGGILVETIHRLLPGVWIELHLTTPERRVAMRGCVLRCAVARLGPESIWYRGAIRFDRKLPRLLECESAGHVLPDRNRGEVQTEPQDRAVPSRVVLE